MKSKRTFMKMLFIIVLAFALNFAITPVFAEGKMVDANLYSNTATLASGQEVQVTLKLTDYQEISKGLNAYKAKLVYDKNIFESVSESDFLSLNNWEELQYNENNGEFIAIKKSGSKQAEEVVTIRLKAKNNITAGETTIKLENVVTSEGEKDIFVGSGSITIALANNGNHSSYPVISESFNSSKNSVVGNNAGNNAGNNSGNTVGNNAGNNNSNKNNYNNPDENETTKIDKGCNMGYILIIIITLVGIIFFLLLMLKNSKDEDKKNSIKKYMILFMISVLSLEFLGTVAAAYYEASKKGELSGDNQVDYGDIRLLELHLISKKLLDAEYLKNADMNNDGLLTVSDLTLVVQKVEKELDIDYNFVADNFKTYNENNEETTSFYKDQNIKIVFNSSNVTTHEVSTIRINGKNYDVQKEEDSYSVMIPGINKVGTSTLTIDRITLGNEKEFEVEQSLTITVIKNMPSITDLTLVEDAEQITVEFVMNDTDKAVIGMSIQLFDDQDRLLGELHVTEQEMKDGGKISKVFPKNSVSKYKVRVVGSYSQTGNDSDIKNDVLLFEKEFDALAHAEILDVFADRIYYEKGSNVILTYSINTNATAEITKMMINDNEYDVEKLSDNIYRVIYTNDATSGVKDLKATQLIYSNGQTVPVDATATVEVLKNAPSLANVKLAEDLENSRAIYTFDILDEDDSVVTGKALVTKVADNSIIEYHVRSGRNEISIPVEPNEAYKFTIFITYDLDTDELTPTENRYKDVMLKELDLMLLSDYQFTFTNMKSYKGQVEAKDFLKDEKIRIGFECSNATNYKPVSVKINGNVYENIENVGNHYYVTVDNFEQFGTHRISVGEVVLSNGKYFTLTENNSVFVNTIKRKPVLSDFSSEENVTDESITVNFNLNDDDNALKVLDIVLFDENNNEISKESLKAEELKTSNVSKTLATSMSATYKVQVNATYAIYNDDIEETLLEQEILAQAKVSIKEVTTDKKIYSKNEAMTLTYQVETNQNVDISTIIMNGADYSAEKLGNGNYQITVAAPLTSGELSLETTRVIFQNDLEAEVTNTVKVEIVKSVPTITNETITNDNHNSKVIYSFDIIDGDNAFSDGKVIVTKEEDGTTQEFEVQKGHNELAIPVADGKKYTANMLVNYDLSINTERDELKGQLTSQKEFQLNIDYQFSLLSIKAYNGDTETNEFPKSEKARIGFELSNETVFEPVSVKINGKFYAEITKEDNWYFITLDSFEELGEVAIIIQEIVLANGKQFVLDGNNRLYITVLEDAPSLSNFVYEENVAENNITLTFHLKDEDRILNALEIILSDGDNKEISRCNLTEEELRASEISKTLETAVAETYKVKINATYRLGQKDIEAVLLEQEILAHAKAVINSITPDKVYYEKEESINLTYQMETNRKESPTKIIVNKIGYTATKLENGDYQITIPTSSDSGVINLRTTQIVFDNNEEVNVSNETKVEVLKSIPTVVFDSNVEDVRNSKIIHSFNIEDPDNSFISGKVIVTKVEDNTTREFTIEKGLNALEIPVEFEKEYISAAYMTYDLDTNEITQDENRYEDVKVSEHALSLYADYNLEIRNIKTYNVTEETTYFSKNEDIIVRFESSNAANSPLKHIVIDGNHYDLTEVEGQYEVQIPGYSKDGVKTIQIEKVILANTHEEELEDTTVKVEVLKDIPKVTGFSFEEKTSGDVRVKFDIDDPDETITSGTILILEDGEIIKEQELEASNTVIFLSKTSKDYIVKVIANYDLDTNKLDITSNEYADALLLEEELSLGSRFFEIKDITRTTVYAQTDEGVQEVSTLHISDLSNLDKYIVKVEMKKMPTFYTTINDYRVDNNRLKLSLDYENVVQYDGSTKQNKLEVDYGIVKDGAVEHITFEDIIKRMNENPSGTFELKEDYDLSSITNSTGALVTATFTGTLNGNGHTLSNLNGASLFANFRGTVENLNIKGFTNVGSKDYATAFTQQSNTATFRNMTFENITLSGGNRVGVVSGMDNANSVFENISVKNANVSGTGVYVSTFVGRKWGGRISNVYVQGSLNITTTENGGLIGALHQNGSIIENVITDVAITKPNNTYATIATSIFNASMIGNIYDTAAIRNSIAFGNMSGYTDDEENEFVPYKFTGASEAQIKAGLTKCYEVEEEVGSSRTSGNTLGKLETVSRKNLNKQFYKDLGFDEEIWDFSTISTDNKPRLKISPVTSSDTGNEAGPSGLYIPDYSRIKMASGFDKNKEILYHNINQLMPYYDAKYLIEDGLKVSADDILNTKVIKYILPFSDGKLLTYLDSENYNLITSIKVVFEDRTIKEYSVSFKKLAKNISIYNIEELNLEYAYGNYVISDDSEIVNTIAEYISNVDYTTALDPLTSAADSRLYKDHYNEAMKPIAKTIALQLLQNDDNIVLTMNNSVLNNKINQELIDGGRLNNLLYGYNYYYRWYNFEIGGVKVSDILLFHSKMYSDRATVNNLVNEVFAGNSGTAVTANFFTSNLQKYTGSSSVGQFLDYIITNFGGYEDVNDWFTEYFSGRGILAEVPVTNHPEVEYRAWAKLKTKANFMLPLITLPKDSGYIISGAAHIQLGALRAYVIDPTTEAGKREVQNKVNAHVRLLKSYFDTLAGSFDVGKWNNYTIVCYETVKTITGYKTNYLPGTNVPLGTTPTYAVNKPGTSEPYHKNFNEAVGQFTYPADYGSAAGVGNMYNGTLWFLSTPGLSYWDTWTHEFQHALGDKILLHQGGMRFKYEGYAQGVMEQRQAWSENNLSIGDVGPGYFNVSFNLGRESLATQNLSPERINTKEKLENYYRGQQNAIDLLDYVSAKAFLQLTPEEQARIATRITESGNSSSWGKITAAQATEMNLTTLESLWDNKIILRPENAWGQTIKAGGAPSSIGGNDYGYESIWVTRWYITHNDSSYSNTFGTKRNMFEMLGYGGVDAFVTYASNRSKNDLDAIQKITLAKTGTAMNWKEYKFSRYATIESTRDNKYVDMDLMIQQFVDALKRDAVNNTANLGASTDLRKIYYHYLKRATNDFIDDPLGTELEVTHITTAQELVEKINARPYGYYILDNDIDFSEMTGNVTATFMGKLDGNGHKIIGNKFSLFQKIRYGYVKDLVFENTNIPKNITNQGALAVATQYSVLENISVNNVNMNFAGRNDLALIAGATSNVSVNNCSVERLVNKITSAQDFEKLQQDPGGIFIIENDIDFTGYTTSGSSVVSATFTGKIDGNGYTISNLNNASLFSNFRGTVENLNISNFTNTSNGRGDGDFVAAFTQESFNATFRNMKFNNITLSGRNNVSVVSGMDGRDNANSVFEKISVTNANVTGTGVYVSTFVGRKWGGRISNVYVQGTLTINSTENGGLVGSLQQNGTVVENVVTDVTIVKAHNTYSNAELSEINGSMFGNIYNTASIRNSIAFGNMTGYNNSEGVELKPYKFTGASDAQVKATMTNCYEVDEEIGSSRVTEETQGKLNSISRASLNKDFYLNLGFDETIWNLDNLSSKGYPVLR